MPGAGSGLIAAGVSTAQAQTPAQAQAPSGVPGQAPVSPASAQAAPSPQPPTAAAPSPTPAAAVPAGPETGRLDDSTPPETLDSRNATTGPSPLASIGSMQEALQRREQAVTQREQAMAAMEQQIDAKLETLKAMEATVKQMLEKAEAMQDQKLKHLIDVYSNMKAKQAATVIETLDESIAVRILAGMPGRQAGEILTNVNPQKAAKLTESLTRMQLPPTEW